MGIQLLFILLTVGSANCSQIETFRAEYHQLDCSDKVESFISDLESSNCELVQPYLASAIMQRAEYAVWPGTKLSHFNEGKEILENYISVHPHSIEARYVRFLVQSELPGLLGYSSDMDSDATFIKNSIDYSDLPQDYRHKILNTIKKVQEG